MRYLLALLLAFSIQYAHAQSVGNASNFVVGAVASSYVGPGDIITSGWVTYPCLTRAFSAATAGTSCVSIERASDLTTTTINTLSNGNLDVATASTFCASTTCSLKTAFDKSGNGINWTSSATLANDPILMFNCNGTLPCFKFIADSSACLLTTELVTPSPTTQLSQPWSMTVVAKEDALTVDGYIVFDKSGGVCANNAIGIQSSTNGPFFTAGTVVHGPTGTWINVWTAESGTGNGASGIFTRNGTQSTGSYGSNKFPNTTTTPTHFNLGSWDQTAPGPGNSFVEEAGVLSVGLTTTQACSLNNNQGSYYGISGTC